MWGRGRVTQVLPRAGSTPRRRALGACGRLSAARSRFAAVSQTLRARSPAGAFRESIACTRSSSRFMASSFVRSFEMTQDFAASLDDGVVFDRACLVEEPDDVFVRYRLDAVDAKEGRLAADRVDLLDEPLK